MFIAAAHAGIGAQIFNQGAKAENWQGYVKKVTENDQGNELVAVQNQCKNTNCNGDQDDNGDKKTHHEAVLLLDKAKNPPYSVNRYGVVVKDGIRLQAQADFDTVSIQEFPITFI